MSDNVLISVKLYIFIFIFILQQMKSRILDQIEGSKSIGESPNENLRVAIRVRPPMAREIKDGKFISTVQVAPDNQ